MHKNLNKDLLIDLPSGNVVHPSRLIHKDGTLMWKHAFLHNNEFTSLPTEQAHESHIIKTAQRLEELNTWVSNALDPWEFLRPLKWYQPECNKYDQGIAVQFTHTSLPAELIHETLLKHKHEYETLAYDSGIFTFCRC